MNPAGPGEKVKKNQLKEVHFPPVLEEDRPFNMLKSGIGPHPEYRIRGGPWTVDHRHLAIRVHRPNGPSTYEQ